MIPVSPATLIAVVTIVISILAFGNRKLLETFILSPYAVVHNKQWWRMISHAFVHADWMHLLFNMIALWSFGEFLYRAIAFTPAHFYLMYLGAVVFASIPDLIKHRDNPDYLSLGASGGVSAIIFSSILLNPWGLIYFYVIPCPGIVFGVLYLIYSAYQSKRGSGDRINHTAHFYGSLYGLIYPILMEPSILMYFIEQLMHPRF